MTATVFQVYLKLIRPLSDIQTKITDLQKKSLMMSVTEQDFQQQIDRLNNKRIPWANQLNRQRVQKEINEIYYINLSVINSRQILLRWRSSSGFQLIDISYRINLVIFAVLSG